MNMLASREQLRASFIRWTLFAVPLVTLLGLLSWWLAGAGPDNGWFNGLVKPNIYPNPMWFGIIWTALYALMGLALAVVCSAWGAHGRGWAIAAFVAQLALNLAWAPVFFGAHQIMGALYILIALNILVVVTVVLFWRARRVAGVLLLPYLLGVVFATVLNWQFLEHNRYADATCYGSAVERVRIGD